MPMTYDSVLKVPQTQVRVINWNRNKARNSTLNQTIRGHRCTSTWVFQRAKWIHMTVSVPDVLATLSVFLCATQYFSWHFSVLKAARRETSVSVTDKLPKLPPLQQLL